LGLKEFIEMQLTFVVRSRAIIFAAFLSLTSSLYAQVSASLSGTVVDASAALVSAAKVGAKNVETGISRETVTDNQGRYQFSFLPVGAYEIRASKAGFAEALRTGVLLVVGQDARVDLSLQVGQASQEITISGDVPLVSASTANIAGLLAETQVKNLPLNGRSYDELLTLNPGVVNFTWEKTGGIGVSNSTVGNNFAVIGNRPQQNLFLMNGIEFTGAAENNMQPGGTSQQLIGVDAVREFNLLADSYGAEYGKRPGAQVLILTQSGTNQVHGSIYEFVRNNAFDARNFFDLNSVPGFQRSQFGGALGGPIKRNKTFLFGNFEEFRQHLHQTGVDLVPDSNARLGYLPCKLVSPTPTCPSSGLVFLGVSPLINSWPAPTAGAPDFGGISEAFNNPLQTIRDDFGTARLDDVFSARDSLNAVYTIDYSSDFTPTSTNAYSADAENLREQVASLEETHIFSPTLLNTARVGFSRAAYYFTGEPTPGTPAASEPGFLSGLPLGAIVVGGSAASNPTAQLSLAGSNNGSNLDVARNLFTYEDRVSFTKGRHQINVGAWFQRLRSNENLALSQYGQATFTSLQTFLQAGGTASTLLYDPTPTPLGWRSWFGAAYVEDVVRVAPNFTLSLGFRDEFTTGWNEVDGRASTYTYPNGIISNLPTVGNAALLKNNGKFLPQPRLGFAWSNGHDRLPTVIRAGFGMYNDLQDALGYRTDQNAPFNPTYSLPNEKVASLPILTTAAVPSTAKLVPGGVQPDLKTPTLASWSFRVQQSLTPNTSLTLGYVGSHGYHELIGIDANEPLPVICPASPCPAVYPNTFPAAIAGTAVTPGTYYVPTATRANATLNNTWTYFSEGDSSYNALQVDLNHRFNDGFLLRGVYTWSRTIDDGDSLNATTSGGEPALASNPYDLRADRGLANFDVRQVAVINASYLLPFGPGKRFLTTAGKCERALVSGWILNSIVTIQAGFPFTPQLSYNPSNNGDTRNPVRPFVNPAFSGAVIEGSPNQWFNPAAFLAPPAASGFYGNLGRDTLIGPGLGTWDVSLLKTTAIHERASLQFRAEAFNVLNRANFNSPNAVVFTPSGVSPTAGLITSTSTTSRQIQLGLKLLW
jgi:hypothetical protein